MSVLEKWQNPDVAAITPYEPGRPIEEVARELGIDPASISKLASNENPLGTSPKALDALRKKLPETFRYPDGGAYYLREKLAAHFGVVRQQVVLGAGSNEILEFIGHCFMSSGRSVVVSAHAFVIYKLIARMFDTRVIEVPATAGLGHDLNAMAEAIEDDTCAIFVCNPNNPTGTLVEQDAVDAFLKKVPDDVLVVFDEAYAEIALGSMPDTLSIVKSRGNCLMLRTFSKAYGLAGLRIGFGMGPQPLIETLQKARQPFNVNRLAQEAALAALDDDEFIERSRELFAESKKYLETSCERLGLDYVPTVANFLLIKVGDAPPVTQHLLGKGIIVRPMAGYGLPEYIRVSFGVMEENRRFIGALKEIMAPDEE
ncbi:MAG: histidinol-phosphate transaminase [Candidatus Pacebacteria bacterium]|nr:histidinol-phosphate transaminase [Candidatus Paceibacterota bacterium]